MLSLENRDDINANNQRDKVSLDVAKNNKDHEIAKLLSEYESNVNNQKGENNSMIFRNKIVQFAIIFLGLILFFGIRYLGPKIEEHDKKVFESALARVSNKAVLGTTYNVEEFISGCNKGNIDSELCKSKRNETFLLVLEEHGYLKSLEKHSLKNPAWLQQLLTSMTFVSMVLLCSFVHYRAQRYKDASLLFGFSLLIFLVSIIL